MHASHRECEATLIILSDDPQVVVQQIAVPTSVANYRLLPQGPQLIRDRYLDTPDKALQAKTLALRIRELQGHHWITLKGHSQPTVGGGVERLEIEARRRDGSAVLKTMTESLISMYGPVLRRWDYSKLATSKAIEQLLLDRALDGLLDNHNHLKPAAHDPIDAYLRRGSH